MGRFDTNANYVFVLHLHYDSRKAFVKPFYFYIQFNRMVQKPDPVDPPGQSIGNP